MKKTLLTLGGVLGMTIGVLAQGSIFVANGGQEDAGFNSVSSNPFDTGADGTYSDFVSGIATLEIFDIPYSSTAASEAATINTAAESGDQFGAISLLTSDFTVQLWGPSLSDEALTQSFACVSGTIPEETTEVVGTSSTLTSGSDVYYALVASYGNGGASVYGCLVLNAEAGYSAGGGDNPPVLMGEIWPNQNLLLDTPEPTTLALAGSGGLSMLFLLHRKLRMGALE